MTDAGKKQNGPTFLDTKKVLTAAMILLETLEPHKQTADQCLLSVYHICFLRRMTLI